MFAIVVNAVAVVLLLLLAKYLLQSAINLLMLFPRYYRWSSLVICFVTLSPSSGILPLTFTKCSFFFLVFCFFFIILYLILVFPIFSKFAKIQLTKELYTTCLNGFETSIKRYKKDALSSTPKKT